jgi:CRP/FNR family transcriptional regulator, nitrogen oxide reductase regulator
MPAMTPDVDLLLGSVPMFKRLSPADRARIAAVTRVRSLARGERAFSEGDTPLTFCLIARGRVKVFKMTPAGKDVILELFGAGDPVGAFAAYDNLAYPASAAAVEDTVLLEIGTQAFFTLLEQHPSLVRGLLAGLTLRMVELTNRVADLSGGRIEPRFARLFLKLADERGRPERDGTFIPGALTRQELADLTGTTLETAIRIMSRWGKDDIVRTGRDGFVLLNRPELETLASS